MNENYIKRRWRWEVYIILLRGCYQQHQNHAQSTSPVWVQMNVLDMRRLYHCRALAPHHWRPVRCSVYVNVCGLTTKTFLIEVRKSEKTKTYCENTFLKCTFDSWFSVFEFQSNFTHRPKMKISLWSVRLCQGICLSYSPENHQTAIARVQTSALANKSSCLITLLCSGVCTQAPGPPSTYTYFKHTSITPWNSSPQSSFY